MGAPAARDYADVLAAIEAERRQFADHASRERREAEAVLRRVDAEEKDFFGGLDRAVAALVGKRGVGQATASRPAPAEPVRAAKPRRRKRTSTKPADARKRREAMRRYVIEAGGREVAPRELVRKLGFTPSSVQSGLSQLYREGELDRVGAGGATRYVPVPGADAGALGSPAEGTLEGLVLEALRDRGGWAYREELVQATRTSVEKVEQACYALIAEGTVERKLRDGRWSYALGRAEIGDVEED